MTTAQILIGFGLILLLAVGSQVLARLFISISATVTPQSLRHPILPTLALVAVLVIVAGPSWPSPPR